MFRRAGMLAVFALFAAGQLTAQQNRVDVVTPMAPELAAYGPLAAGVRTITATDRGRVDVLSTKEGGPVGLSRAPASRPRWTGAHPGRVRAGMEPAGFSLREPERTSPIDVSSGARARCPWERRPRNRPCRRCRPS